MSHTSANRPPERIVGLPVLLADRHRAASGHEEHRLADRQALRIIPRGDFELSLVPRRADAFRDRQEGLIWNAVPEDDARPAIDVERDRILEIGKRANLPPTCLRDAGLAKQSAQLV